MEPDREDERTDVHLTRGYHALSLDFSLAVEDEEFARYLEWLLDGFTEPVKEPVQYTVEATDDGVRLALDGAVVLQTSETRSLVESLVLWLNQQAVDPEYAVIGHAGGVERRGVACVLPADPESGKTTLTAGLVRVGYAYVTDEAVAFDWETGEIEPYPKPLSIDPGSQFLFPELVPPPPPGFDGEIDGQWQVPPSSIRGDAVGGRCRAKYLVFPKYEADVVTRIEPIARAEALVELAKNTFRFREHPRRSLDSLARVIAEVECYRMSVGDLDTACTLIDELMSASDD
jgi:hypothetical protein